MRCAELAHLATVTICAFHGSRSKDATPAPHFRFHIGLYADRLATNKTSPQPQKLTERLCVCVIHKTILPRTDFQYNSNINVSIFNTRAN